MRPGESAVLALVAATGVASVVVQLVSLREILTLFQGNEFVIALILFCWLAWGGIGSLAARGLASRPEQVTPRRLCFLSILLAVLAPLLILGIRWLRDVVFLQGSSVGFYATFGFVGLTLAPYTFLLGLLLPLSLMVLRRDRPRYPGARVYITDNLGDTAGGALFAFALVYWATPLQAVGLAQLPLLAATWRLSDRAGLRRPWRWAVAGLVLVLLGGSMYWEVESLIVPLRGRLETYRETRFGRIEVYRNQGQVTLFKDGVPVTGSHQIATAEAAVHYPLAQLDRVAQVLLIAGESGMLEEVQRHAPRAVDYLEIDPVLAELQFHYGLLRTIPGLRVIPMDGRAHLQRTARIYDAIIISLPEPDTFQINRFFTDEFFQLAREHLSPGGVLSFSMPGFDNYLSASQRRKLACLYGTAGAHFRHVRLLPGARIYFLCRALPIDTDIPAALARKGINTRYVRGYYYGDVSAERIEALNRLANTPAPRNADHTPRLMQLVLQQWFDRFGTRPAPFIVIMGVALVIYLARMTRPEYVLFSTGFMTMGGEILVIFAFQILFGYIYFQIGLIVTVFLAGLMPGAWLGTRMTDRAVPVLRLADLALIMLMAGLALALSLPGAMLPVWFFLAFGFMVSLTCGFQFPLALHLEGGGQRAVRRFFAADLMGAAAGTLVTSTVLIPYAGLMGTLSALMFLKGTSLFLLGRRRAST
ncbi:MAG: hypothetical protein PVJ53_08870 [Desulfobacterales bacterium]|jgi:spermidine synthase